MRKPVVKIIGASGRDLFSEWSEHGLTSVSFTDNDGTNADEISFVFAVSPPFQGGPTEGQKYGLEYGWEGGAFRDAGSFTYQSSSLSGDPESGYSMTVTARSSDFIDAEKNAETEHFDDTTVGEIFSALARKSGKTAIVDARIATIKVPYRLRYNQSTSGFAQDLAEDIGGTLKFANGRMIVSQRNGGTTAGGNSMPEINVAFDATHSFELSMESKGKYRDIEAPYFDEDDGQQKFKAKSSIGTAATFLGIHPAGSADEADMRAAAEGAEMARASLTGSVELDGDETAMAGAPVKLSGFGAYDQSDLIASSISHEFTFDDGGGWLMTIELGNRESQKATEGTPETNDEEETDEP